MYKIKDRKFRVFEVFPPCISEGQIYISQMSVVFFEESPLNPRSMTSIGRPCLCDGGQGWTLSPNCFSLQIVWNHQARSQSPSCPADEPLRTRTVPAHLCVPSTSSVTGGDRPSALLASFRYITSSAALLVLCLLRGLSRHFPCKKAGLIQRDGVVPSARRIMSSGHRSEA